MKAVLRTDSDLEAFVGDYFPSIRARYANGMDREQKITLLLDLEERHDIWTRLKEAYPKVCGVLPSVPVLAAADEQGSGAEKASHQHWLRRFAPWGAVIAATAVLVTWLKFHDSTPLLSMQPPDLAVANSAQPAGSAPDMKVVTTLPQPEVPPSAPVHPPKRAPVPQKKSDKVPGSLPPSGPCLSSDCVPRGSEEYYNRLYKEAMSACSSGDGSQAKIDFDNLTEVESKRRDEVRMECSRFGISL